MWQYTQPTKESEETAKSVQDNEFLPNLKRMKDTKSADIINIKVHVSVQDDRHSGHGGREPAGEEE